jgi:hypothetical protein
VPSRRTLVWIPVIQTETDLGDLYEPIRRIYAQGLGHRPWRRHVRAVKRMWSGIRAEVARLDLDYRTVRLYQDGLPVCGREPEIVRALARAGSLNHRFLLDLMEKGGTLTGTESPDLLVEEYERVRECLQSAQDADRGRLPERLRELSRRMLEARDAFIARRVDETLEEGETGLLFLGMLHSMRGRLPPSVDLKLLGPGAALR